MEVDSAPSSASAVVAAAPAPAPAASTSTAAPAPAQEEPAAPAIPAVETVYVNNLNEKISPKIMKQTLKNLFRQYGAVLDVVAHRNLRMRGQAFVAMIDRQAAERAVKEVRGFPLYGKPVNVAFARTPADAVVKRKTPDLIEVHLEERKRRKSASYSCIPYSSLTSIPFHRDCQESQSA
jgi:RNA recognition motif-containing protein